MIYDIWYMIYDIYLSLYIYIWPPKSKKYLRAQASIYVYQYIYIYIYGQIIWIFGCLMFLYLFEISNKYYVICNRLAILWTTASSASPELKFRIDSCKIWFYKILYDLYYFIWCLYYFIWFICFTMILYDFYTICIWLYIIIFDLCEFILFYDYFIRFLYEFIWFVSRIWFRPMSSL